MYYTFLKCAFMPSSKSRFSRLSKYNFFSLFTCPVFPDLCSNFLLSSRQQFGSLPISPLSCDALPFCAEGGSKSASDTRREQVAPHPVDTAQSGISSFAKTHASKSWLLLGLWSALFLQCWLLSCYSAVYAWAFGFAVPRLVLSTSPY